MLFVKVVVCLSPCQPPEREDSGGLRYSIFSYDKGVRKSILGGHANFVLMYRKIRRFVSSKKSEIRYDGGEWRPVEVSGQIRRRWAHSGRDLLGAKVCFAAVGSFGSLLSGIQVGGHAGAI